MPLADASPLISWDTWGLIAMGVVVTALWLYFRRIFPDEPPGGDKKP
jgi:hypothetical protein